MGESLHSEKKKLIREAIEAKALDVQLVVSTAIPEVPVKPTIDIAIAVENSEDASQCIEPMKVIGYDSRGENGIPRRHYFIREEPANAPCAWARRR
jgi:GrpB-like predicted nucleotidyltransferase (UPF0157 family)